MVIPENMYLGSLCKRGHDYGGTGKSLRYVSNGQCVVCKCAWRRENREKVRVHSATSYKRNYASRRKLENERGRASSRELIDTYIKKLLANNEHKFKELRRGDIPDGLVQLKRAQLQALRQLKEARKCQGN